MPAAPTALRWTTAAVLAGAWLAISGLRAAGPPAPAARGYGLDAPILEVDRFSDRAGTIFRRSQDPSLPGPNAPLDLDATPFASTVTGPDGMPRTCYNLDFRPSKPARYYVFYDRIGNYLLTQFPVIEVAPGDPAYSDIWDIWKVTVPDGLREDNTIRDGSAVDKLLADPSSGFKAGRTGILLNGPVVPEGSRARLKADGRGGSASLRYAWYRGQRAPYLYFEGSLRAAGEAAPIAAMTLSRSGSGAAPSPRLLRLAPGDGFVARVAVVPGDPAYSPLWKLGGEGLGVLPSVTLNCPLVGQVTESSPP